MPPIPEETPDNKMPLVVDLDGTLIKTDLLWESVARLLRQNPLRLFQILFWWTHGRAYLKQQLAARVTIDPATLPYNEPFLKYLREQKNAERKIILATASDLKLAKPVADFTGLFDEVLGSDGRTNLRSGNKLKVLVGIFAERGFDYAGNSSADLAVWRGAREAVVVNASPSLVKKAAACAKVGRIFERDSSVFRAFIRSLRPHQWVKNLIIFVPVLAAHKLGDTALLLRDAAAVAVFSLCASGVYVMNDLVDLDFDRQHSTKKNRPFTSGDLPLPAGLICAPLFLMGGILLAAQLSWLFAEVATVYVLLTTSYSWWLKRVALLDVFLLAGLYTIRLVAGHAATGIVYSNWLLMFSMFIFLSLALVKRYVELSDAKEIESGKIAAAGRGYVAADLELIGSLGTGSGYLAALVLALYVNSQQVIILYDHPNLLLLICPLLLFWISRMWLLAHRGRMHDDPVFFSVKDAVSYIIGALALAVLWVAAGH
jgi:4-hydroxybenzoate polyprenyltransferase/phosphoserine phosphatase